MAQAYRLVGSQDPGSRIDRILFEGPSEDYPDGKTLELNGPAFPLSEDQYGKLSRFVKLEPADIEDYPQPNFVDQPGVNVESLSTDIKPEPAKAEGAKKSQKGGE